jgi:hypothetical protein
MYRALFSLNYSFDKFSGAGFLPPAPLKHNKSPCNISQMLINFPDIIIFKFIYHAFVALKHLP